MDIVEKLRSPEVFITDGPMISPVAFEAADEIIKLREALLDAAGFVSRANTIEQLRKDRKLDFELMDTFVREINRLRRELRRIASIEIDPDFGALPISDAQKIAQDALEDD